MSQMNKNIKTNNGLIGKFFHSYKKENNKIIGYELQGKVVGQVGQDSNPEYYLITLCSWGDGREIGINIVAFKDMLEWQFYNTNEEMLNEYEYSKYSDVTNK